MEPVLYTFRQPLHPLDVVGRLVIREGLTDKLREWQRISGAEELVYLATCQRVLWIVWGGDATLLSALHGAERLEGEAAWRHLLALAAGLESANLGDREVTGQLRDALQQALAAGTAGEEAEAVVEDAIREGQRLRARLGLADGSVSVASAALHHLEQALPPGAAVAIVGVGPMSRYLAERLPERGFRVTLANRTRLTAELWAAELGLEVLDLAALQADPAGFDAIVTATASPEPIFTAAAWVGLARIHPLLLLDLALPADAEAALDALPWVRRTDLAAFLAETATARAHRAEAARAAAPLLAEAAGHLRHHAESRHRKRSLGAFEARLHAAWDGLEREAARSGLDEASLEAARQLLRRGRTLAYRALIQGPGSGVPRSSGREVVPLVVS